MQRVDPRALIVIAPEGRMMRANGLDSQGKPMTVRGGIADILAAIPSGRILLAYSAGLHHVQVPGQRIPRLFQDVRMSLEMLDIAEYKQQLGLDPTHRSFKPAVKQDLERRRETLRPPPPPAPWPK